MGHRFSVYIFICIHSQPLLFYFLKEETGSRRGKQSNKRMLFCLREFLLGWFYGNKDVAFLLSVPGDNLHSFDEQISGGYLDSLDILIIEDAGCFNQRGSSGLFSAAMRLSLFECTATCTQRDQ